VINAAAMRDTFSVTCSRMSKMRWSIYCFNLLLVSWK
jgi:hypothetical protein